MAKARKNAAPKAARIGRLRQRLQDAQRRGEDFEDGGEGLRHRALVRRFNQVRNSTGKTKGS